MLAGMSNASVSTNSLIMALSENWFHTCIYNIKTVIFALSPEINEQASRLLTPH